MLALIIKLMEEFFIAKRYDLLVGIIVSFIGFFFALFVNSLNENRKERNAFAEIIKAIKAETEYNKFVHEESFLRYIEEGIVLRNFNLGTTKSVLSNPLFFRYASAKQISIVNKYLRDLELSNSYRSIVEKLRIEEPDSIWLDSAISVWKNNLVECSERFNEIEAM